jgi:hypothetical protein
MSTTLKTVVTKYLRARRPAHGTRDAYHTTLRKWKQWGSGVPIENLGVRTSVSFSTGSTSVL